MDAVKKHHFWILLGIAIPMILYGYMAANGALKEATTKREGEIKTAFDGIPPSSNPNAKFAEGMKLVNEKHKKQVDTAIGSLWKDQAKRMVWPAHVAAQIPKAYRGEITAINTRFAYKSFYPSEFEKVFYSFEPMVPQNIKGTTHTPKVFMEPSALTVATFASQGPPLSEDVWDAQEDLWLLQMLADAIRETNKYADGPSNATVRSIDALKLIGGNGTAVPKAAAGAAGSGGGAEAMAMPMGSSGGGGAGVTAGGALVNPAEEFGPDTDAAASSGSMDASAMPMTGGPVAVKRIRYIGATDKTYKERGFYLRVIISQMKIPELLTTLTNSPWPVRIVRFNMSPNPHDKGGPPGSPMGSEGYPMAGGAYEGSSGFGASPFGGSPYGGSPMGFTEGAGGAYPGGGYESSGGFGGATNVLAADAAGAANIIPGFTKVPDKFGALQQPDLIQLDVLGAITLYNAPTAEEKPAEEGAAAPMTEGTPPAAPMADGTAPMADPAAPMPMTPADSSAAPATPPADPAAAPAKPAEGDAPAKPAETPAADPAATPPAAPAEGAKPPEPAAPEAKPESPPATENPGNGAPAPPSN